MSLQQSCKECGEPCVRLPSRNQVYGGKCKKYYEWTLKEGQESVYFKNVKGGQKCD